MGRCAECHTPPYLHDGRLLTLEDTVEFFNLVGELKLENDVLDPKKVLPIG